MSGKKDVFGFIRPEIDVHTLGISTVSKLLEDCGYEVIIGDADIATAVARISKLDNISLLIKWINRHRITRLGFSYRLDPNNAQLNFGKVVHLLRDKKMFKDQGGPIEKLYFAGLPEACYRIDEEYHGEFLTFIGDETQIETLRKLDIPPEKIPSFISQGSKYDDDRLSFAKSFIESGSYRLFNKTRVTNYPEFGTFEDTLAKRISANRKSSKLPLTRVHVGPYQPNYIEAKKEFLSWLRSLSVRGLLDIVSVGSSQLSQSDFGTEWGDRPNGGGVPINSEKDLNDIWQVARPMLVRTYSATRNVPQMAEVYERTINIAWHALSLWWFNKIDGRGPYDVLKNLQQHFEALKVIARHGKPFEPNIPHHFSFRGGDDYTYVLSSYLAALAAKRLGIRYFVLQTMLNTPKYTWGVQDLAKARALLKLVRELEDRSFTVFHQPRAGLDYFSPNLDKAKIQLAAVTMMMDDIEPENANGPDIIHVVSYCEAITLATPEYINESIQITLSALEEYRYAKLNGLMEDMNHSNDVSERTEDLYFEVKSIVTMLEAKIPNLYTPEGFYEVFRSGVFAVPYLWEGREEFAEAVKWKTGLVNGSVQVLDEEGKPIKPSKRLKLMF
jgi:hypothetical protein